MAAQARQALAAVMVSWADSSNWRPSLIPAVFAKGAGIPREGFLTAAQVPSNALAAAGLDAGLLLQALTLPASRCLA